MPMTNPWTVIGGATAAVAIGVSGLVFTGGGDDDALRGPINLRDGRPVAAEEVPDRAPDSFEVVPNPVTHVDATNDSPDDSPALAPAPAPADSPDDSPDDSPAAAPAPASDDSPDDSPDGASVDSPDASG